MFLKSISNHTKWASEHIAAAFEDYVDVLECALGFSTVFHYHNENTPDTGTMLDYGCGPGKVAYRYASMPANQAKRLIAVDASANMLSIAKESRSHANIEYCHISNNNIDFIPDNSLDAAMINYVFINIGCEQDIIDIMSNIYRKLKPGGHLSILDTNPNSVGIQFSTFCNGRNKAYSRGEERVEYLKLPSDEVLMLHDFHWPQEMYVENLKNVGFSNLEIHEPTLKNLSVEAVSALENDWNHHFYSQEFDYSPFVIFTAQACK